MFILQAHLVIQGKSTFSDLVALSLKRRTGI